MDKNAQVMFQYLREVIYSPDSASLDLEALEDDFKELGKGLVYFGSCIAEVQSFTAALSKGNVSVEPPSRGNELAAPLKALHASLVHLTWQTQQVAKGDYKQRVDFMGEFAEAFNLMIQQLDERQQALINTIHAEKQQVRQLETYAYKDALTGIYNRFYGLQCLEDWTQEKREFCLCFVDIDNLKYVNDTFGHPEGDRYIIQTADAMEDFSKEAILCRLGGDEFMILAPGLSFLQMEQGIEGIRSQIMAQKGWKYIRSISYGIVEADADSTLRVSDLLGIADERMYEYKRAHKEERNVAIETANAAPGALPQGK